MADVIKKIVKDPEPLLSDDIRAIVEERALTLIGTKIFFGSELVRYIDNQFSYLTPFTGKRRMFGKEEWTVKGFAANISLEGDVVLITLGDRVNSNYPYVAAIKTYQNIKTHSWTKLEGFIDIGPEGAKLVAESLKQAHDQGIAYVPIDYKIEGKTIAIKFDTIKK